MLNMQYAEIPYVNKKVSRILFGAAGDGFQEGADENELLDAIFAMGVNTFDTARQYALSENTLGKWIYDRSNRDQVVILSKCGHPSPNWEKRLNEKAIREDFALSSKALGTDYIDIYLMHRDDPDVEVGCIVELFNALHAEGKIGAYGGSNWTHQRIEEANEYAYKHNLIPFSVSSPNFGLADQKKDLWGGGSVSISGPANQGARDWYRKNQLPVVAYSSLGRGLFSGRVKGTEPENASKYMDEYAMKGYGYPDNFERLRRCEELAVKKHCSVPQIAMAWIFRQKLNTFAVVSTTKASRMQENIDALHIELSEEEVKFLDLK